MSSKRGQSLTLNTVIIAILVLLVLVVLSLFFLRTTRDVTDEVRECSNRGGSCTSINLCDTKNYDRIMGGISCPGKDGKVQTADDEVCCVKG